MRVPVEDEADGHREGDHDDSRCRIAIIGSAVIVGQLSVVRHSLAAYAIGRVAADP